MINEQQLNRGIEGRMSPHSFQKVFPVLSHKETYPIPIFLKAQRFHQRKKNAIGAAFFLRKHFTHKKVVCEKNGLAQSFFKLALGHAAIVKNDEWFGRLRIVFQVKLRLTVLSASLVPDKQDVNPPCGVLISERNVVLIKSFPPNVPRYFVTEQPHLFPVRFFKFLPDSNAVFAAPGIFRIRSVSPKRIKVLGELVHEIVVPIFH